MSVLFRFLFIWKGSQEQSGKKYLSVLCLLSQWTSVQETICLILILMGIVSPSSLLRSVVLSEYLISYCHKYQMVSPNLAGGEAIVKDSVSSTTLFSFRNITFSSKFLPFSRSSYSILLQITCSLQGSSVSCEISLVINWLGVDKLIPCRVWAVGIMRAFSAVLFRLH